MNKHTPGPWHKANGQIAAGKPGFMSRQWIALMPGKDSRISASEQAANADFIVLACNCHDDLVQALEGAFIALGNQGGNYAEDNPTAKQELLRKAWLDTRAAIAKATT